MHHYRTLLLLVALFAWNGVSAQKEEKAIKEVINRFFEGMAKGDSAMVAATCTAEPLLQTYMADRDGALTVFSEEFSSLLQFIGTPSKDKFREEIEFEAIHVETSLASVWTPYKFYLNDKLHHSGTNSFQLVKTAAGWKIQYIIDTRRKTANGGR